MTKKTKKIKNLEDTGSIEIDLNTIGLEEILIALGGVLFAGAELYEIEDPIFKHLENLIVEELHLRETNNIHKGEALH
jgi:hypothetical protein